MFEPFHIVFPALLFASHIKGENPKGDASLALKIKNGDKTAFRSFYERYHQPLMLYLRRFGLDEQEAGDLLQQAFISLWEKRAQIDSEGSIRALLYRIAWSRALNYKRDNAKFENTAEPDTLAYPNPNPEEKTEQAELVRALNIAVAALPEKRRQTFELCFMQQFTYGETAVIMNVSVKTVENQMVQALAAVRKKMEKFR